MHNRVEIMKYLIKRHYPSQRVVTLIYNQIKKNNLFTRKVKISLYVTINNYLKSYELLDNNISQFYITIKLLNRKLKTNGNKTVWCKIKDK